MKIKALSLLLTFFVSLSCLAYGYAGTSFGADDYLDWDEPQWLEAPEGRNVDVSGDGFEAGFSFSFSLEVKNGFTAPKLHTFVDDNSADCNVIFDGKETFKSTSSLKSIIKYSYSVETSVEGDTGGCIVHLVNDDAETLKTIHYSYVTNY